MRHTAGPVLTRRAAFAGAATALAAAALPGRAGAAPDRTHYAAIVIGTGFGGAVAAARLGAAGVDTLVLERGRSFPHDDRAATFAPGTDITDPRALWAPQFGRTGVLEAKVLGSVAEVNGAAVGGGSVVYCGATVAPHPRYYDKVFRAGPSYRELSGEYVPRAVRRLRAEPIPGDVRASAPFASVRAFDAMMARAGMPCSPLASTFDWGVVRRELRGEVRASTIAGECGLGNSNGSKRSLDTTYLRDALEAGVSLRTLHRAVAVRQERDRLAVEVEVLRSDGAVDRRRTFTCGELYLGAGAYGTTELLLASRLAGGLTRMNEHVGTGVGDNCDQFLARVPAVPPHPDPMAIVSSAFVDDDPNYQPMRVENLGTGIPSGAVGALLIGVDWENRTRWSTASGRPELVVPPGALTRDAGPAAARVAERVTAADGGVALTPLPGSVVPGLAPAIALSSGRLRVSLTAHLLGGAPIGLATDAAGRLHGHPAIRIVDGALNPGNACGANPSLVITAFAEYVMDRARRAE